MIGFASQTRGTNAHEHWVDGMTLTHDRSNHVLNGTLKSSDVSEASFTGKLLELIAEEFKKHGAETKTIPSLLPAAHPRPR
ncbi:hypothetical protein FHX05_005859 [Rhizobium sp. BK491]|nr:hypothetical protein [Rhizobium sp. BK491]